MSQTDGEFLANIREAAAIVHVVRCFDDENVVHVLVCVANVDEDHLNVDNDYVREVQQLAAEHYAEFVKLCAKLEQDMAGLSDEERHEFLESMGIHKTGLEQVIHKGFHALGLILSSPPGQRKCGRGRCRAAPKPPKPPA